MKKSAYIITKPLQYINASNIEDDSDKVCMIIDNFSNSKQFVEKIKEYSKHWEEIQFFENRKKCLNYILKNKKMFDKLYMDTDMGLSTRLRLIRLYSVEINVYEEGFGNYRGKIRDNKRIKDCLIGLIDRFLGRNYLGGFCRTKHIFLYHKNAFLKLVDENPKQKIKGFKRNFFNHLMSLKEITYAFPNELKSEDIGEKVLVFLTARKIDDDYKNELVKYENFYKILKPHPELSNRTKIEADFDYIVEAFVSAELLIAELLESEKQIIILHHGDTTILNLPTVYDFKEINISKNIEVVKRFEKIQREII